MIADSPITQRADQAVAVRSSLAWRLNALRVCLVPFLVVLCYQFDWQVWRELVASAFLVISSWFGVPAVRLDSVSFICNGESYYFAIACTALDAFFGSIPLLWNLRATLFRNLAFLAAYFLCLSVINLMRLEIGLMIYLRGVPWSLAHEALAGVFYFGLFLWIVQQRRWS